MLLTKKFQNKMINLKKIFFLDFFINLILIFTVKSNSFVILFSMTLPFFIYLLYSYKKLANFLELNYPEKYKKESIYLSTIDVYYLNPIESLFENKSDDSKIKVLRIRYKNIFLTTFLSFTFMVVIDILNSLNII